MNTGENSGLRPLELGYGVEQTLNRLTTSGDERLRDDDVMRISGVKMIIRAIASRIDGFTGCLST